ncbi:isoprenyl transferase [Alphaproteobacteria bacterium]|nr:isoprenyl transferase [Alphaproteobacteria bacterium]
MELVPSLSDTFLPPTHVGIIMDGNGRWAQSRGMPRIAGHRQGAESVRVTISTAVELGIQYLTLYGFSIENWKRPMAEVTALMGLLRLYLRQEIDELNEKGVRIRFIGERKRLAQDIVALIEDAENRTETNTALDLIVALSYGARQEITDAARKLVQRVLAGELAPDDIDERVMSQNLATVGIPDLDLVIRTSGEKRVSNFLLWQLAYAELIFVDTLWPDFSGRDLEEAVNEFHRRERRYGAIGN